MAARPWHGRRCGGNGRAKMHPRLNSFMISFPFTDSEREREREGGINLANRTEICNFRSRFWTSELDSSCQSRRVFAWGADDVDRYAKVKLMLFVMCTKRWLTRRPVLIEEVLYWFSNVFIFFLIHPLVGAGNKRHRGRSTASMEIFT